MVNPEFERVRDLLADVTGVRAGRVAESSRLVEDLGVDGDDLLEFMDRFFTDLPVDPAGYRSEVYVPAEGFRPFGTARRTRPLMVATLVEALRSGRWPDEA